MASSETETDVLPAIIRVQTALAHAKTVGSEDEGALRREYNRLLEVVRKVDSDLAARIDKAEEASDG